MGGESIQKSENNVMTKTKEADLSFCVPTKEDGAAVWGLIEHTGVLDLNSSYSYLLWCEVFSDTSITVVSDEETVGFISGFIHPEKPNTLFIWQVAVHESERGRGLGTKMLRQLLNRQSCASVEYIEATVSPSNTASQRLFKGLASKLDTNCKIGDYFSSADFPKSGHEDELLFKIGPIHDKNNL